MITMKANHFMKRLLDGLLKDDAGDEPALLYCALTGGLVSLTSFDRAQLIEKIQNRRKGNEKNSTAWLWGALHWALLEDKEGAR